MIWLVHSVLLNNQHAVLRENLMILLCVTTIAHCCFHLQVGAEDMMAGLWQWRC